MVFFDGHEREDVVEYRDGWSKRMMEYYSYSEKYATEDAVVVIPPELPDGVKQHVFVTHDDSTFYSNDFQRYAWLQNDESYCLPKSQGRSIMISEFQCPCHGTMRGTLNGKPVTSRVIFYPGANHEGYWKSIHMQAQLSDVVIPLFKLLHPDKMGVFLFDQSSNHKAFPEDALVASKMNMNPILIKDDDSLQGKFRDQSFYVFKTFDYAQQQKILHQQNKTREKKVEEIQAIFSRAFP